MRCLLLVPLLLVGAPAFAQGTSTPAPPAAPTEPTAEEPAPSAAEVETPPAPQVAPVAEKSKVLVLDLQTTGVDPGQAKLVDELLTVEMAKYESFDVLSGADVRRMVELEAEKQAVGCEDSSCLADIAGAMGARYVVYGRIGKLGSRLVLTLNLFDSETAGAIGRSELKPESLDVVPDQLPGAVERLVAGLVKPSSDAPGEGPSADTPATPDVAQSATDVATDEPGPGLMTFVWPAAFAVTGGAILVVGVVFDTVSPTSDDAVLDGFDVVGPAVMAVGLGTAVVGFLWNPFAGGDDA